MDGQALLLVLVIALVACCLIPALLMARMGRREVPGSPGTGAGGRGAGDDRPPEPNASRDRPDPL